MVRKVYIVVLGFACVVMLGYSFVAITQEAEEKGSGDVIVETDDQSSGPERRIYIKTEGGDTVIKGSAEATPDSGSGKRADQERNTEERRARRQRFQGMMQKEGVPPEGMMNPEASKKLRERAEGVSPAQAEGIKPGAGPQPGTTGQPGPPGGTSLDEKIQRLINAIMSKNLFLPLGSGREEPKPSYALTAIISNTSEKPDGRAIIEQLGSQRSFYVSKDDTFADNAKVTDIEEWAVKVDRSGEQITLKLGEGTQGGSFGGGGAKMRPGAGGEKGRGFRSGGPGGVPGGFDSSRVPPFVQKMLNERGISIEDLKNNPELQEKLRNEFEAGQKSRPESVAPTVIEFRSK